MYIQLYYIILVIRILIYYKYSKNEKYIFMGDEANMVVMNMRMNGIIFKYINIINCLICI